jgi:adenosylhomocysteine nucleosidase
VDDELTLACALEVEEKQARKAGAAAAVVGLGARLPAPGGPLVSFGLAGGLVPGLEPGTVLTAYRIVDPDGRTLWEGEPLDVPGAERAVICSTDRVVNEPEARRALAEASGAVAVDMESGTLAATGRLAGVVRAVSDGAEAPVGCLACAATEGGKTDWMIVAKSFATEPVKSARTATAGLRALRSLEVAAGAFARNGRV